MASVLWFSLVVVSLFTVEFALLAGFIVLLGLAMDEEDWQLRWRIAAGGAAFLCFWMLLFVIGAAAYALH